MIYYMGNIPWECTTADGDNHNHDDCNNDDDDDDDDDCVDDAIEWKSSPFTITVILSHNGLPVIDRAH